MKQLLLTILIVLLGLPMLAQEVHFPPAVLAGGGGGSDGNAINVTKWRLSQVHVIHLNGDISNIDEFLINENVTVYPNPVKDFLNIKFLIEESLDCKVILTDVLGRIHLVQEQGTILPNQVIKLNLSDFLPAIYLLRIESPEKEILKTFSIQKL